MPMQGVPEMYGPPVPEFSLEKPTPEQILGAAWRQSTIGSVFTAAQNADFTPVPGYGVKWDDIKDNPLYVEHAEEFAGVASPAHFDFVKSRIERDAADRRIKAASGTFGLISDLVMESPLMGLPGSVAIGTLRNGMTAARGVQIARGAAEVGAAAFGQGVGQAMITQAAHPHPLSEDIVSIGSSTLLAGLLGAGIKYLSPAERAALVVKVDKDRAFIDAHVRGEEPLPPSPEAPASPGIGDAVHIEMGGTRMTKEPVKITDIQEKDGVKYYQTEGSSAYVPESDIVFGEPAKAPGVRETVTGGAPGGAGVTDTRDLEHLTVVPTGIGLEKLPDNAVTRSLRKSSLWVRRRATELAETAVLVKGNIPKQVLDTEMVLDAKGEPVLNAEGKPVVKVTPRVDAEGRPVMTVKTTTPGGMAPIETIARTQQIDIDARVAEAVTKGWMETNFGGAANAPWFAKLRDDLSKYGVPSSAKVTYEDFSKQVSDAAMVTAPSPNPHIQHAVDEVRAIWDEYGARAEASVEGFKRAKQAPGESHFPHDWDRPLIQAKQPEFLDDLTKKFAGDQAANAATQSRLASHQGALKNHETNIKNYTRQLEQKQAKLAETEGLREEVSKINKLGFQRATALRESEAAAEIGRRGGAPFETAARKRVNTLADRASAYLHEVAEIEEKLQAEHASAAAVRGRIEEEIGKWHGTSTAEAMSAIKAREAAEAEREAARVAKGGPKRGRLTEADDAVDRAVDHILNTDQDLSLQDLRDEARQALDHIISSPVGRLPYDKAGKKMPEMPAGAASPLRGSLAERSLDVTNAFAKPWIQRDIHKVMRSYARTFVPDVLLAERYGDAEMPNQFREIMEEYSRLIDAARGNEKEIARLGQERKDAIADIAMLRDRIRGLFQIPTTESQRTIGRISAAVRNFTHMAGIGMGAVSSIPDASGVIARWGLSSTFNDAWAPLLKSMMTDRKFAKEVIRQMEVMRVVNETITASRHHSFHGVTEPYSQGSWFERTLQKGADITQIVNLMAPQTDLLKAIAGTIAATGIYRAAKRAAAGEATKLDLLQLGQANIAPHLYEHIAEQYEKSGNVVDGHMLPNTENWKHAEAKAAFEAAIHRDVNLSVVTPGIDKPAFISDPVMGVFTQFKSYTAAATTRILVANLQRSDAQTLQGLMASLGFGAMAYYVHSVVSGQPVSKNPADWIKESVSRGNITGWLDEANTLSSKLTRGRLNIYRGIGASPDLSRTAGQSAVENLLGPTFGKLSNLTRVTGAMATGDVNAGDIHALRRAIPWNNMLYWNRALTEVEKNVGSSFGIKQPQPRAQ